jgi:hypothetical protein
VPVTPEKKPGKHDPEKTSQEPTGQLSDVSTRDQAAIDPPTEKDDALRMSRKSKPKDTEIPVHWRLALYVGLLVLYIVIV